MTYTKQEILTMLTSFTQENKISYAEQIYEILERHLTLSPSSGLQDEKTKELCDEIIELIDEYFPANQFKEHIRDLVHALRDKAIKLSE